MAGIARRPTAAGGNKWARSAAATAADVHLAGEVYISCGFQQSVYKAAGMTSRQSAVELNAGCCGSYYAATSRN